MNTHEYAHIMQVLYATEKKYALKTLVSMTSLCHNAKPNNLYQINILYGPNKIDPKTRSILYSVRKKYSKVCRLNIVEMEKINKNKEMNNSFLFDEVHTYKRLAAISYYRL